MTTDSITDFTELIVDLYNPGDDELGLSGRIAWLCEEVGELAQAARKGTREEQVHELGDVLAWVVSVANFLGIDLTEAMQRYYDNPPKPTALDFFNE